MLHYNKAQQYAFVPKQSYVTNVCYTHRAASYISISHEVLVRRAEGNSHFSTATLQSRIKCWVSSKIFSTLKAICFEKTEETPAIRSAPQIH
jgi:hypothetical protein